MAGILRIGVAGAMGRMGRSVIEVVRERDDVRIQSRLDHHECADAAAADGPLATREEALSTSDVIIDFSTPAAASDLATLAAARGRPALVIGATGFSEGENAAILAASRTVPIVKSGNFSIGVNVLAGLVAEAARRLSAEDWDIEIVEAHHRRKRDAPSGTALMLGEAAASARGVELSRVGGATARGRKRTTRQRRARLFRHSRGRDRRGTQRRLRRGGGDHHAVPLRPRPSPVRARRRHGGALGLDTSAGTLRHGRRAGIPSVIKFSVAPGPWDAPHYAAKRRGRPYLCPVDPKPPAPRIVSSRLSSSRHVACSTGAITSCAMRSPRRMMKSSSPRLISIALISPR